MLVLFPSGPFFSATSWRNIHVHNGLLRDLESLLPKESEKAAFLAAFELRADFLSAHLGTEHLYHSSWFEVLKNEDFRGMRFRESKFGNLRILYCIDHALAFLLVAFQEKKGKRDYSNALSIARSRMQDIEGGSK